MHSVSLREDLLALLGSLHRSTVWARYLPLGVPSWCFRARSKIVVVTKKVREPSELWNWIHPPSHHCVAAPAFSQQFLHGRLYSETFVTANRSTSFELWLSANYRGLQRYPWVGYLNSALLSNVQCCAAWNEAASSQPTITRQLHSGCIEASQQQPR